ncbi:hypothetical protein [Roseivivax sp. CAU 1753]
MFAKPQKSRTSARRIQSHDIPVYYPTVPKARTTAKVAALLMFAAVLVTSVTGSVAHADAVASPPDASLILAQEAAPGGRNARRGPPPRAALAACEAAAVNAACGFATPDGRQIEGTCRAPDAKSPLACAPAGIPRNG